MKKNKIQPNSLEWKFLNCLGGYKRRPDPKRYNELKKYYKVLSVAYS